MLDDDGITDLIRQMTEFIDNPWMEKAACKGVGPELWFPLGKADTTEAKAVCADCPVREECLEYALRFRIKVGVWGGLDERERDRLVRERGAA